MTPKLVEQQNLLISEFEKYANQYFAKLSERLPEVKTLWESVRYSFSSGGKRFRPFIACLVSQAFENNIQKIIPYAFAVEMIHTYSLIHDDLPCMDNDDFRRGQPTNHKVYGEDIALLAGDTLLTEAFAVIAQSYEQNPKLVVQLILLLTNKAGALGMIGGQVLDMKSTAGITAQQIQLMHKLKTGALIESAVVGSAYISEVPEAELQYIKAYAENIGLAFQIKDDILDMHDKEQDFKNFVNLIGLRDTQAMLSEVSERAIQALKNIQNQNSKVNIQLLLDLVQYNLNRDK